jgi:transcriptional antiterminator NusG
VKTKGRKACFPGGYVFLRSSADVTEIIKVITPIASNTKEIYRLLNYGDNKADIAVWDYERQSIERLLDDDFCMTASIGFIEGDQVRVVSGSLVGMESQIKKINKHNRTAIIEVQFLGEIRKIVLMLEVLDKV